MTSLFTKTFVARIKTVFWITIAWTIFSLFKYSVGYYTVFDVASLPEVDMDLSSLDSSAYLRGSVLTGLLAGIIGGSGIVFVWDKWLRSRSYGYALGSIFFSYLLVYCIVSLFTSLYFYIETRDSSFLDRKAWVESFKGLFEDSSPIDIVSWLIVVICTMIVLLVNDKYGPGVFKKFLLGRYFRPRREERIFMFLDLRSSTTIAEELKEEQYFSFLKDLFEWASIGILNCKGEIYQYVGDEVVVSWDMKSGVKNDNCIRCFFEIRSILSQRQDYFTDKYGVAPVFKAGLHGGFVMAGEVGVVKRDIVYSGDVLNTTARIQSKCNELGVDILISKLLLDKLDLSTDLNPREMGTMELRGKKELVTLFSV